MALRQASRDIQPEMNIGTIRAMEDHGGSFVKSLAACWRVADPDNKQRLESAFPHLFAHYEAMFVNKDFAP